jgi:hypothetical protein
LPVRANWTSAMRVGAADAVVAHVGLKRHQTNRCVGFVI